MKMTKTTRKAIRQRKICMLLIIILIIVLSVLGGGYYLLSQKNASSPQNGGQNSDSRNQTDLSQNSDIVEYKGETYKYNDHLSNYLFLGIDTRETVDTYQSQADAGQADAIFLVSMDRATEKIKVLFIPRDSMTRIEVFNPYGQSLGETTDHLNIQYAFGDGKEKSCELMKTAVSNMLDGLPIQGYCSMNMDGISVITDFVGGIQLTIPDDSLADVNPEYKKGAVVDITGETAEQFVRYRDIDKTQSALVRQERQKTFLQALVQKAQEKAGEDAGFVTGLYDSVKSYTVTNMGNDIFAKLLAASQNGITDTETVPGEGTHGENFDEYHIDEDALSDLIISMFYEKI
ncbi:LCP family protein [Blautia wexlerae]|jgi:LCP family protein required for cell wall assembly|uniref:LCP family protein n=1 Tax=Blautia wexlerae TaxID=418240 RepID=UPI001898E48C|nr:LCP family protein [Blautia wexlerae]MDC0699916.1 LCP family protein [Blautia wexlerae]